MLDILYNLCKLNYTHAAADWQQATPHPITLYILLYTQYFQIFYLLVGLLNTQTQLSTITSIYTVYLLVDNMKNVGKAVFKFYKLCKTEEFDGN